MNEKNYEKAVQLRHELHMHPELSMVETWTKNHLMEFMKANTTIGDGNINQGALTDEDLELVISLIENIDVEYFDCGHGIHLDKKKDFVKSVIKTLEVF